MKCKVGGGTHLEEVGHWEPVLGGPCAAQVPVCILFPLFLSENPALSAQPPRLSIQVYRTKQWWTKPSEATTLWARISNPSSVFICLEFCRSNDENGNDCIWISNERRTRQKYLSLPLFCSSLAAELTFISRQMTAPVLICLSTWDWRRCWVKLQETRQIQQRRLKW